MNTSTLSNSILRSSLRSFAGFAAAFAALVVASKISVSIGPVPLTMQTCAIGLIGALLGARKSFLVVASFVAAGLAGLPIFATPLSGPAALLGPTGGYLLAFPFGAFIAGYLAEKGWSGKAIVKSFIAQALSNLFIVLFGGFWLMAITGSASAFTVGLVPFFVPAILKSVLAASILAAIQLTFKQSNK